MGCAVALVAGVVTLSAQMPVTDPLRTIAERYVKLVLAVGQHDADYVDAFYGPAEWRKEAEAAKTPLATIDSQAAALEADLTTTGDASNCHRSKAEAKLNCGACGGSISRGSWRRCARASACCRARS